MRTVAALLHCCHPQCSSGTNVTLFIEPGHVPQHAGGLDDPGCTSIAARTAEEREHDADGVFVESRPRGPSQSPLPKRPQPLLPCQLGHHSGGPSHGTRGGGGGARRG